MAFYRSICPVYVPAFVEIIAVLLESSSTRRPCKPGSSISYLCRKTTHLVVAFCPGESILAQFSRGGGVVHAATAINVYFLYVPSCPLWLIVFNHKGARNAKKHNFNVGGLVALISAKAGTVAPNMKNRHPVSDPSGLSAGQRHWDKSGEKIRENCYKSFRHVLARHIG